MIDSIEIDIHNGVFNKFHALIDYKEKKCYINNKIYNITDEFLEKLKTILYSLKKGKDTPQTRIYCDLIQKKDAIMEQMRNYKDFNNQTTISM